MSRFQLIRMLFLACVAAYPFIILFGLKYFPPSFFGVALLVLLALRFGVLLPEERPVLLPMLALFVAYALAAAIADSQTMLLYYPALVNLTMCGVFVNSLRQGEPLLLRIVRARGVPISEHAPAYLWRLTVVWVGFFVLNGLMSVWTTTRGLEVWTLYNGFLSYLLIAILAGGEYVFRQIYKRRKGISDT